MLVRVERLPWAYMRWACVRPDRGDMQLVNRKFDVTSMPAGCDAFYGRSL